MANTSRHNTARALSLKQPWATLLVYGRKTIEVRRWSTTLRGRVLIHAARIPDERREVWALLPPELRAAAKTIGGIIGAADLRGCIAYRDPESFRADQSRHLNDPAWFEGPVMYGFTFANPVVLPFRPYKGWVRFFSVQPELPAGL
jgi:hypothetical protein